MASAFRIEISPECKSSPVSLRGINGAAGGPRLSFDGEGGGAVEDSGPLADKEVLCSSEKGREKTKTRGESVCGGGAGGGRGVQSLFCTFFCTFSFVPGNYFLFLLGKSLKVHGQQ